MTITEELEYKNVFNPKTILSRRPFFWQHSRWETVQGHKDLKIYLVIWARWQSEFRVKENLIVLKQSRGLNEDEGWETQICIRFLSTQCSDDEEGSYKIWKVRLPCSEREPSRLTRQLACGSYRTLTRTSSPGRHSHSDSPGITLSLFQELH